MPILYLVGGLVVSAALVGFILDATTPLNERLHDRRDRLPAPVGRLYEGAHRGNMKGSGVCRCTILAIEGNILTVEDTRDATTTLTVVVPTTGRRATTTDLSVGDVIFIAGEEEGGIIEAFGIRKEDDQSKRPFMR